MDSYVEVCYQGEYLGSCMIAKYGTNLVINDLGSIAKMKKYLTQKTFKDETLTTLYIFVSHAHSDHITLSALKFLFSKFFAGKKKRKIVIYCPCYVQKTELIGVKSFKKICEYLKECEEKFKGNEFFELKLFGSSSFEKMEIDEKEEFKNEEIITIKYLREDEKEGKVEESLDFLIRKLENVGDLEIVTCVPNQERGILELMKVKNKNNHLLNEASMMVFYKFPKDILVFNPGDQQSDIIEKVLGNETSKILKKLLPSPLKFHVNILTHHGSLDYNDIVFPSEHSVISGHSIKPQGVEVLEEEIRGMDKNQIRDFKRNRSLKYNIRDEKKLTNKINNVNRDLEGGKVYFTHLYNEETDFKNVQGLNSDNSCFRFKIVDEKTIEVSKQKT